MDSKKIIKEAAVIVLVVLVCALIMVGIFAILGQYHPNVLWSALGGWGIFALNYFLMASSIQQAAERAASGDAAQAEKTVRFSSVARLFAMGALLLLCLRLGANVLALLLPLTFVRPILMLAAFWGKKGDGWKA